MDVNFEYYKVFYYAAKYKNFTKRLMHWAADSPTLPAP